VALEYCCLLGPDDLPSSLGQCCTQTYECSVLNQMDLIQAMSQYQLKAMTAHLCSPPGLGFLLLGSNLWNKYVQSLSPKMMEKIPRPGMGWAGGTTEDHQPPYAVCKMSYCKILLCSCESSLSLSSLAQWGCKPICSCIWKENKGWTSGF